MRKKKEITVEQRLEFTKLHYAERQPYAWWRFVAYGDEKALAEIEESRKGTPDDWIRK